MPLYEGAWGTNSKLNSHPCLSLFIYLEFVLTCLVVSHASTKKFHIKSMKKVLKKNSAIRDG